MEAYQAYYNTNEASSSNATQVLQAQINVQQVKDATPQGSSTAYPHSNPGTKVQTPSQQAKPSATTTDEKKATADAGEEKKDGDAKVIKNVVHIDQKGANINITNINNHQTFVIYANNP